MLSRHPDGSEENAQRVGDIRRQGRHGLQLLGIQYPPAITHNTSCRKGEATRRSGPRPRLRIRFTGLGGRGCAEGIR